MGKLLRRLSRIVGRTFKWVVHCDVRRPVICHHVMSMQKKATVSPDGMIFVSSTCLKCGVRKFVRAHIATTRDNIYKDDGQP